jgi:hypothetical protein
MKQYSRLSVFMIPYSDYKAKNHEASKTFSLLGKSLDHLLPNTSTFANAKQLFLFSNLQSFPHIPSKPLNMMGDVQEVP